MTTEDKQIYAYSWKKDITKKVKNLLLQAFGKNKALPQKTTSTKHANNSTKAPAKKKPQPEESKTAPPSRIRLPHTKEFKLKLLTLFMLIASSLFILLGIAIGNRIITFSFNPRESKPPFPILTPSATPPLKDKALPTSKRYETTPTAITPSFSLKTSPNPQQGQSGQAASGCRIGGCNGEICADESLGEISSICVYLEKYQCYKNATCERQKNGKCGWTQTEELKNCLDNFQ
jgi:eight-cysteine-cluster-containing protein